MTLGLREHLVTITLHWVKILVIVAGSVLTTGAIGFLSSKVYVAETRILILSRSPAARATPSSFSEDFQSGSPEDQVLTQVEILKSPLLVARLAEELGPERVVASMTWRWDWLRELPRQWRDDAIIALADWPPTREFVRSSGIAIPTGLPAPITVGTAAGKIGKNLHVNAILKTDMFGVAMSSPDPAFAAEALNRLIEIYADYVVTLNRPARTAEIARAEVARLQAELRETEKALHDYADAHGILSIERQKDQLIDRLARVQDDQSAARREMLESKGKITSLEGRMVQLPREEAVSVTTVPNPLMDRLNERLSGLEAELVQFVPGSFAANKIEIEIRAIRDQLNRTQSDVRGSETIGASVLFQQLQGSLAQEYAEYNAQLVRLDFLTSQQDEVVAEIDRLEALAVTYNELSRAASSKEEAYRYALQKREETAISDSLSFANSLSQAVQVEPAVQPAASVSPRRFRLLALGVVVGTMVGIALSYVLEFLRGTVANRREAEIALGCPVIGVQHLPGLLRWRGKTNRTELRSLVSRLLNDTVPGQARSLLLLAAERAPDQTGLVDSIARAVHAHERSVLVIRPVLARRERDAPRTEVTGNDGKAVRDPGEYRAGDVGAARRDTAIVTASAEQQRDRVSTLLKERRRMYDMVIIDCPALSSFPEAMSLAAFVDAGIPVVEADRALVQPTVDLVRRLDETGISVPGVIVTRQRRTRASWAFCWMAMMRLRDTRSEGPGSRAGVLNS